MKLLKHIITELKPKFNEFRVSLYLLRKNKLTYAALLFVLFLTVIAILAPHIVPHPEHISQVANPSAKLTAPCKDYLFGTDELGGIFSAVSFTGPGFPWAPPSWRCYWLC